MIGRTISRYAIESRLGQGGMGTVYLAHDTQLDRRVAIKVISADAGHDRDLAERLLREAQAASRLNHPNIVTVYEIGQADGIDFIAMEHVDGQPLSQLIPPGGLPIAQVLDYAQQIVAAVAVAHEAGVIHRDLKPSNVLVTSDARVKVLDFGLAKRVAPDVVEDLSHTMALSMTTPGALLGTIGYIAPEQIEGKPASTRSDVFALGVILCEMLTGRRPYAGDTAWAELASEMSGASPRVLTHRPNTPRELARIVEHCLARKPEDRYASAVELQTALAATAVPHLRSPHEILTATVAIAVVAIGVVTWLLVRESRVRWARETAVVEIPRLNAEGRTAAAYHMARKALSYAPNDAGVKQAWNNFAAREEIITSDPPGAHVSFRGYRERGNVWVPVGTTPAQNARIPLRLLRWRLTKPGYDTLDVQAGIDQLDFHLVKSGTAPPGMVFVPSGSFEMESSGEDLALPAFWLDRYEVTNRQFKQFMDAGGYTTKAYWKEPFVENGRTLSWDQAMSRFRDATGRPGPATWELGSYAQGQDDVPVGGVSWYEAAAYAAFAKKQLPTAYHWHRAAGAAGILSDVVLVSNFSGKGPVPVGSTNSLGLFGTYDMPGNVKEWCWNQSTQGRRYVLGGGWDEPSYMFHDEEAQSPFDRRPTFGFRCMEPIQPIAPRFLAAIATFERNTATIKPVGDDVFQAYQRLYDYDRIPLDEKVEHVDDSNPAWRMEKMTVRAPYGNERLPLYVFVPKSSKPPYQAVVFSPGSNAVMLRSSQNLELPMADFVIRAGRMLVYPVYQGTYERHIERTGGMNQLRDILIQRGKEVRRAVDYLDSRNDVDASRIAFQGLSLGAQMGPVYLAIEPRFRTGVLISGGFETWEIPPECDPVNFASRVRQPVLMVNGREDFDLPYATAQVPLFRALGSAEADKKLVVLEGGHVPLHPQEVFRAALDWMDRRMGVVR